MSERSFFTEEFKRLADPVRAKNEKKYLKSSLHHYGVTVPSLRKLTKTWLKNHQDYSIDDVLAVSQVLWEGKSHEEKMVAIFLLVYRSSELTFKKHFKHVDHMVKTAEGWAQLDMIAAWLCGSLYEDDNESMAKVMRKWNKSNNFWVRRASVLTLLGPARNSRSHFVLFEELSVPLLSETEFFIRKALGWVLREVSKIYPDLVEDYVRRYAVSMSGLTFREATKKLSLTTQKKLNKLRT